ncbi:MAG: HU family DNA-binding protein [Coleofasciculaceae cyanobacterium]
MSLATGLSRRTISTVINGTIDVAIQAVCAGERVQIIDFGAIARRKRNARTGRSPKTGEEITIPEAYVPAFSAGKAFKDMVKASSDL